MSEAEGAAPKKKKPLMLIVIGVNALLAIGAGAFFVLRGGNDNQAASEGEGDKHGDETGEIKAPTKPGRTQGPLVEFSPIIVNLNEPEGARFLKIQVVVQLANDSFSDMVEQAKPIVRDHFIRELSDLNFRQTMGNKAKLAIKRRLIKRFNESVGADAAVDIHITQFIVQ